MSNLSIPFNVYALVLTPEKLKGIKPVRVLDIFDNTGKNFHEDGLFSTSIFGKSGEEIRDYRFSYIDIKVDIFHPILFKSLHQLKSLYSEIMSGKEYAIWDEDKKDFERATALEGQTGYHFFMQHWMDIQFVETKSDLREQYILLVNKYRETATTNKVLVIPAGLRDIEFSDNSGRMEENEINKLYRKLLSIANVINESSIRSNPEIINPARWSLQSTFNEIFDTFETVIEGKKKLVLGKWASRKVFNGTRNVITSMDTSVPYLGQENTISFNNTVVGLFQCMKSILPVARYHIRNGFLSKVFISKDLPVRLVNKKTLKSEEVMLRSEYFDRWSSDDGIDKVIESFREEYLRHKVVEINGFYLGLIYKGPDMTFKIIQDIDDVPEGRDKKDVHPLTLCELLYLSIYREANKYPLFVTRYPVAGIGSIQPSFIYLKTTIKSESRKQLNDEWEPFIEGDYEANEFPKDGDFLNSLIPHSSRIVGLVADFDGDTCSANCVYTDNAVKEIKTFFGKKKAYVGTDGRLLHSTNIDTVAYVLHNLTSD